MPAPRNASRLVLGIMSGTSMDGVDYALCRTTLTSVVVLGHWQVAYPARLRERVRRVADGEAHAHETCQLHHDLGRFYARHATPHRLRPRPQLVGLHGQTVFHRPHPIHAATVQLGEPAYLAEALRVPVVSNFRAADLAAGGEGAPLATLFHRVVFGRRGRHVCVNNLGGISNVTSLDWRRGHQPFVLAFDTGPANVLLDLAVAGATGARERFDAGGRLAARGTVHRRALASWLKHPYLRQKPPKSTGRELFGRPFLDRVLHDLPGAHPADRLATLTEFTAGSIALNYRLHLRSVPDAVVLAGGGACNGFLVSRIAHHLHQLNPEMAVTLAQDLGWDPQTIEPAAFALLAWYRWREKAGNLPETTGAARPVRLGQLTLP